MTRLVTLLATAALASTATAHFGLLHPESSLGGADNQNQNDSPCGGYRPSEDDETVDFYVSGDAVAIIDMHSQSDWILRATLESDASGDWEQLYPIYRTTGSGRSCLPQVTAPADWAGRRGVVGVVGSATDGLLFSCAPVRFVNGSAPDREECRNGTSVSIRLVENAQLLTFVGNDTSSDEPSGDSGSDDSGSDDSGSSNDDGDSGAASLHGAFQGGFAVSMAAIVGGAVMLL
ncbi:hypothetical protein SODALDRAFT_333998 [Sodiomyces alkalinus F11]|uniref:Copper acquisition factor BIM1-like domain-containing protein n=1 Tax=Sodiomyces alkalinus (strain CBS 110278 / VKM F-3762 / F11) TaxID=1314773 RepID=A0A3N2PUP7_SODAK|nr:hypothetical protein SODALDRAFT_333998 [Sodiomyces alkalinus F11]ROT38228.1 hypothetical protein SODALDRAFT_333998 [Sodiomyces alkalinus F11]